MQRFQRLSIFLAGLAALSAVFFAASASALPLYQYSTSFGSKGTGNGQFEAPLAAATDSAGNFWVVDGKAGNVQKFNSKGEFLLKISKGKFTSPTDIAIDSAGNIWVVDHAGRIVEYSSTGTYLSQFGEGLVGAPNNIAIDSSGNFWITGEASHNVKEFNSTGKFVREFGSAGSSFHSEAEGNGKFARISGIATDSEGNVWVADENSIWELGTEQPFDRIEEFNSSGVFIKQIGHSPLGIGHSILGQISGFDALSIHSGNLWVADGNGDEYCSCVKVLNTKGEVIGQFGGPNENEGSMVAPKSVTFDLSGNPWVVNSPESTFFGLEEWVPAGEPTPPTATTEGASKIYPTQATINGQINPKGSGTKYEVEVGTTVAYGKKFPALPEGYEPGVWVGAGINNVAVHELVYGLVSNTTYHYRVVATNAGGTVQGADKTFTTHEHANEFTTPSTSPTTPRNWYTGAQPGTKLSGTQAVTTSAVSNLTFSTSVAGIATKFTATGVECSGCKIENRAGAGENIGNTEAAFSGELSFTGVKMLEPANCSMTSTLKTKPMTGVAGGEEGSSTVAAFQLSPSEGTSWATVEVSGEKCAIAGLYKMTGKQYGEFANPLGVDAKTQKLRFLKAIQEGLGTETSLKFGVNALTVTAEVNLSSEAEFQLKEAPKRGGPNLFTTPSTSPTTPRNWYTGAQPGTKLSGTQAVTTSLASEKLTFRTSVAGIATKFTATGVECAGCKIQNRAGTGENVGNTEAAFSGELSFTGAKMLEPANCSMSSTLKTKPMTGVAGGEKGSLTVAAFQLAPTEGTNWVTVEITGVECPIAGLYKMTGKQYGEFANPLGVDAKTQKLLANQGIQESFGTATSMKFGENSLLMTGEVNLSSEAEFQLKEK